MCASTEPSRPRRSKALAVGAAALLLVIGLGACGDDDDVSTGSDEGTTVTTAAPAADDPYPPGGVTTGGDEAEGDTVVAADFSLTSITVAPGSQVTFENGGEAPHTMTADDGSFDSGRVEAGASTTLAAPDEPGEYPFHCEIHPAMTGALTVEG